MALDEKKETTSETEPFYCDPDTVQEILRNYFRNSDDVVLVNLQRDCNGGYSGKKKKVKKVYY